MEENANKPDGNEPAPEVARLLKILDAQRAARPQRAPSALQTPAFRYGALIAIAVFTFGTLGLLEWFLSQIERPAHPVVSGFSPAPTPGVLHGDPTPGQ
jgi:hypothetical protein